MNSLYFLVQQTMFFSIPLLVVALGALFSERSGVVNIALEGIMVMGAFTSIFTISALQKCDERAAAADYRDCGRGRYRRCFLSAACICIRQHEG